MGNPELWAPPAKGDPGLGEFECMFLEKEPQYDLMRDVPPQQYRYMGLPLKWSNGEPKLIDADETLYGVYFFYYHADLPVADGEDWYLGHHVREAKLMKQLGKKHYQTWRTLRVPEEPGSRMQPNKWYRLTELGLLPWGQIIPEAILKETVPEITRPAQGNTFGEWRNIVINPELVQDFLA
jgi:hypothetical protein